MSICCAEQCRNFLGNNQLCARHDGETSSFALSLRMFRSYYYTDWPNIEWWEKKKNETLRCSQPLQRSSYKRRNSRYQWNRSVLDVETVVCVSKVKRSENKKKVDKEWSWTNPCRLSWKFFWVLSKILLRDSTFLAQSFRIIQLKVSAKQKKILQVLWVQKKRNENDSRAVIKLLEFKFNWRMKTKW